MKQLLNLTLQIERYLPQQSLELINAISSKANQYGQRAYLVGGIVRDILLGHPNFDLDLVIEGDAVNLAHQIAKADQVKLITHPRFGTAKLRYNNFTLDMATARGELYAKPGALPQVTPGTINGDLFRRDFSINAMAISLNKSNYGDLIDPYQGKIDLEHHLIRILHPDSFRDDATRIFRAARYEQRLKFEIEPQTVRLLKHNIPMLDTISGDRIRHELELIFREKQPEQTFNRLTELGALKRINTSLKGNGWIAEKFEKARSLNKPSQLYSLYLCLLIYHLHTKENEQLINRLNISTKLAQALRDTLRLKSQLCLLDKPCIRHNEIYHLLHKYSLLAIQVNVIASESGAACSNLDLFLTRLRYVKTSLNGEDLIKLGIPAGPELGKILQILHTAKLNGLVRTRAQEVKLALSQKH